MKKFIVIVLASASWCQLNGVCPMPQEMARDCFSIELASPECVNNDGKPGPCNVVEIPSLDEYFDDFDAFADGDEAKGIDCSPQPQIMPAWMRAAGLAVLLKMLELQELMAKSLEEAKKILGMSGSDE